LRHEESYVRSLKIRKTKIKNKKDIILKKLRENIENLFQVEAGSEYQKESLSSFLKNGIEKQSLEGAHVISMAYENIRKIKDIAWTYKINLLENRFRRNNIVHSIIEEKKEEIGINYLENRSISNNVIFYSKAEAEAEKTISFINKIIESDLKSIEEYLESEDLVGNILN